MSQVGPYSRNLPTIAVNRQEVSQLEDWLQQTQNGNRHAFSHIVEYYQRPIYNLCYRMLGNTSEAEDAVQETFFRAYVKLNTYDHRRKFSTWLFAIASHHCLDRLRKGRRLLIPWEDLPGQDEALLEALPHPEQVALQTEAEQTIQALLHSLPVDYRVVIILKYWQDKSCEEIAEITRSTTGTVKSRLFRARKQLAKRITGESLLPTKPRIRFGNLSGLALVRTV